MKKIIVIALMACALVSTAFAEDQAYKSIRLGFDVDYTMVAMSAVNAQLDILSSSETDLVGTGFTAMLQGDLVLTPFLMAGVRAGYLYCMPVTVNYWGNIQKTTLNTSLIPVEAGLSINLGLPGIPISIMAGIYGGYGIAAAAYENVYSVGPYSSTYTQSYEGGGLMGEALATINYKLDSGVSLNINGGYRLAKIAQMKQSAVAEYTDNAGSKITVGAIDDVRKDSGTDVIFDYSGFNLGVGICLGF